MEKFVDATVVCNGLKLFVIRHVDKTKTWNIIDNIWPKNIAHRYQQQFWMLSPLCVKSLFKNWIKQLNYIEKLYGKYNNPFIHRSSTCQKNITRTQSWFKCVDKLDCKSVFERHLELQQNVWLRRECERETTNSLIEFNWKTQQNTNINQHIAVQMDYSFVKNSQVNKMRSVFIRNVCIVCAYLICPSMEEYKILFELGIAIAVTLIENVFDRLYIDRMAISSQDIEQFATR